MVIRCKLRILGSYDFLMQTVALFLPSFFLPGTQTEFWRCSSQLATKISVILHTKNDRACSNSVCSRVFYYLQPNTLLTDGSNISMSHTEKILHSASLIW